jgi:hypothetical protein
MRFLELFAILVMLFACQLCYAEKQIWSYGFVTVSDRPVGGEGGSIFECSGAHCEGRLWSQDRLVYTFQFTLSSDTASGVLLGPEGTTQSVNYTGIITRTAAPGSPSCIVRVEFKAPLNYVLLDRGDNSCRP